MKGISERLSRAFKRHGAILFHKPSNSIKSRLTKVKDKTQEGKRCGTVYHIKCGDCAQNYIGETARPLDTRIKEHRSRVSSAVFEHTTQEGHNSDLQVKILCTEPHWRKRKTREAIEIFQSTPSLNRDQGLELAPVFKQVLSTTHRLYALPVNNQHIPPQSD